MMGLIMVFVLAILCVPLGIVINKKGWYFQAVLVIAGVLGLIAAINGLRYTTDSIATNDTTGILLLLIGIATLIVAAILIRKCQKGKADSEQ